MGQFFFHVTGAFSELERISSGLGFEVLSDKGNTYAHKLGLVFKVPADLGPQNLAGSRDGYIAQDFARALAGIVYESKTAA